MGIKSVSLLLSGTLSLVIGIFVLVRRRRNGTPYLAISLTSFCIFIWSVSNSLFFNADFLKAYYSENLYYYLDVIANLAGAVGIWAIWIFSISFPNINKNSDKYSRLSYIFLFLITILILWPHLFIYKVVFSKNFESFHIITTNYFFFYGLFIATFFILISVFFLRNLNKSRGIERLQLSIIASGAVLSVITGVVFNLFLPQIFHNYSFTWIGPTCSIILMASIAYASLRYRFIDTQSGINSFIEASIFGILTVMYFYIVFYLAVSFFKGFLNGEALVFVVITAYFYVIITELLKKRINTKEFIKGRYSEESLLKDIQNIINNELDINVFIPQVLNRMQSSMDISGIILILIGALGNVSNIYRSGKKGSIKEIEYLLKSPPIEDRIFVKEEIRNMSFIAAEDMKNNAERKFMESNNISVLNPIYLNKSLVGLFIFFSKEDMSRYTLKDINVITNISNKLSIALSRGLLYKEVLDFNKTLKKKINEATEELRIKNIEINKAYEETRIIAEQEKEMLDIMGHELRTPATVVKMATYLLDEEMMDKEGRKQISRIKDSIERQIKLINTFIDTARIDNNKIELNLAPVKMNELLMQSVEDHMEDARIKKLKLTYVDNKYGHSGKEESYVMADRTRLREVIDNLISNAIKYTSKGKVEVLSEETKTDIVVKIKDTGEGIKERDKKELFQKFKRVNNYVYTPDASEVKIVRPGGTGLGLYVSKGIIELHKGKIWVDSEYKKGSDFCFSIPLAS